MPTTGIISWSLYSKILYYICTYRNFLQAKATGSLVMSKDSVTLKVERTLGNHGIQHVMLDLEVSF